MQPVELPLTPAGPITVGPGAPLLLLAGPCVLESAELAREVAVEMQAIAARLGVSYVFKASFDKANRTSLSSFRGPGAEKGLRILARLREELKVPVVSDIHEPAQAVLAADSLDILQIPAFLCRQTDLLVAAARTGKVVNIKKGQFVSPWDMAYAVDKVRRRRPAHPAHRTRGQLRLQQPGGGHARPAGAARSRLPGDLRCHPLVQLPGGAGGSSGGQREFIPPLARGHGRGHRRALSSRCIRTRTGPCATGPTPCPWPGWKGCCASSWRSARPWPG